MHGSRDSLGRTGGRDGDLDHLERDAPLASGYTLRLVCTNGATLSEKFGVVRFDTDPRVKVERRVQKWAEAVADYEPDLRVTHHFPLHTRDVPPPLRLVTRHALLTYSRKHWPGWQAKLLGGLVWAEAGARGTLAAWRKDPAAAACYRELRRLVGDVARGRTEAVTARIRYAARFLDPIASEQDGRTGF